MSKLYELKDDYLKVLELMEDEEVDVARDTLEAIEGEIEVKVQNCIYLIRMLENEKEGFKREKARMAKGEKSCERQINSVKNYVENSLKAAGLEKLKTEFNSLWFQNNPPSFKLDAETVYEVPESFLNYPDPTVNASKAIEFLKTQEGQKAEWGHLEQERSLRIR